MQLKNHNITPLLSLKLQRRVRQKPDKSEIPVGGRITDVDVSICTPRRIIIIRVNGGVSVGRVRTTVLDLSVPVALEGKGIGWDHLVGMM